MLMDTRKAAKKVYAPNNSFNNFDPNTYGNWQIDHIFVSGGVGVRLFETVVGHRAQDASDHLPILADISLSLFTGRAGQYAVNIALKQHDQTE